MALLTPYDDAIPTPGLARGGTGTSGGVDVGAAGAMVVQTAFTDAIAATPGNTETANSMSGLPPQNTIETFEGFGGPGGGDGMLPFAQIVPAGSEGRTLTKQTDTKPGT